MEVTNMSNKEILTLVKDIAYLRMQVRRLRKYEKWVLEYAPDVEEVFQDPMNHENSVMIGGVLYTKDEANIHPDAIHELELHIEKYYEEGDY
tara:strand:- start:944 stop:1219 length:276 start_codon:yes stop_codon:yes gene_type:complete